MAQPKTASKFTGPPATIAHCKVCKATLFEGIILLCKLHAKAPEMYELLEKVSRLGTPLLDEAVSFLRTEARRIKAEIDGE